MLKITSALGFGRDHSRKCVTRPLFLEQKAWQLAYGTLPRSSECQGCLHGVKSGFCGRKGGSSLTTHFVDYHAIDPENMLDEKTHYAYFYGL